MSRRTTSTGRGREDDFIVRGFLDRETCEICRTYNGKLISSDKAFQLLAILKTRCSSVVGCRCRVLSVKEDNEKRRGSTGGGD